MEARGDEVVLGLDERQLALAEGGGLLQHRVDDVGGAPHSRGHIAGLQQCGQEHRRGQVAGPGERPAEQRGRHRPCAIVAHSHHRHRVRGRLLDDDGGDEHDIGALGAQRIGTFDHLGQRRRLAPGQEVQLVVVRRQQVGVRHDVVAQELRDAGQHVHAAPHIAHDRVAAPHRAGVALLDQLHDLQDFRAHGRRALVAGEHGVHAAQHTEVIDPLDHIVHVLGAQQRALLAGVAGVVREVDREHRPHLTADPHEREGGGAVAHVPVGDVGLDRQNRGHEGPFCTRERPDPNHRPRARVHHTVTDLA